MNLIDKVNNQLRITYCESDDGVKPDSSVKLIYLCQIEG